MFSLILAMSWSAQVYATVDAQTEAWIVVANYNLELGEKGKFFLQKVPVSGCYGLPQGPQLTQFTSEFKIESTMGCGNAGSDLMNINELACAEVIDSLENKDYMSFKKIVLDISNCSYKNDKQFITMVRTAAARNFPQSSNGRYIKNREVELILKK